MADDDDPRLPTKESQLLEELRRRQEEWSRATHDNREFARQRFLEAMEAFLAMNEDPPEYPPKG